MKTSPSGTADAADLLRISGMFTFIQTRLPLPRLPLLFTMITEDHALAILLPLCSVDQFGLPRPRSLIRASCSASCVISFQSRNSLYFHNILLLLNHFRFLECADGFVCLVQVVPSVCSRRPQSHCDRGIPSLICPRCDISLSGFFLSLPLQ